VSVSAHLTGLSPDAVYHYRLVGVKGSQTTTGDDATFTTGSALGVDRDQWAKPTTFSLQQNYPNPFNPSTTIRFAIPNAVHVSLKVYNVLGSVVADLVNGNLPPGLYSLRWNALSTANGVYFYRLEAGTFVETKRLLLLK